MKTAVSVNDLRKALDFFDRKPNRWASAMTNFDNDLSAEQLINISKNEMLYSRYNTFTDHKFRTLSDALDFISTTTEMILIHFTDLSLYGALSLEKYLSLVSNFRTDTDDNEEAFNPRQLILSDRKQKMVFIYAGSPESRIALSQYIKDCLKSNITIDEYANKTEITLTDLAAANYSEANSLFEKLSAYIFSKNESMADNMRANRKFKVRDIEYTTASVGASIEAGSLEELGKILKTVHCANMQINIVMGNAVVNGNVGNMNKTNQIADWIRKNPPEPTTGATKYRDSCNSNTGAHVSGGEFSKIMKDEGYSQHKTSLHQVWRKA